MDLKIEGGHELHGEISVNTSKNSAVAMLCASLLNHGTTKFKSFPRIEEVYRIIEVLESIGVQIEWLHDNDLEIRRPSDLKLNKIKVAAARKTRSVLLMIGSLLHEYDTFRIPYAGGCKLGIRTITPHVYALQEFGVDIVASQGHYNIRVNSKSAGRIVLYESGDTATENVLLVAAGSPSETIIHLASAKYMVQDLCLFLQKLGIEIHGIGTTTLRIRGVCKVNKNMTFTPSEDPIEAMFFTSAAATTNSEITIRRVPIDFMALDLLKLSKMGLKTTQSPRYKSANGHTDLVDVTIHKHDGKLFPLPDKLHANVYPAGINQDNLPYFVPIAAVAQGQTLIHDWAYENRAIYYTEMAKLGACVELVDPHRLYVLGPTKFIAADVACPPALRPASLLLIGMLAADGTSILRNVYTTKRGYGDISERLNSLGARITAL